MELDYEKLLKSGMKSLPESVTQRDRFEIPKVLGHVQGNKTIITNFLQIAGTLRREQEHLLKYLLKELATPGEARGATLILGTKVPASRINEKIRQYAMQFVLCMNCGKPDTKIEKDGNFTYMKCMACGHNQSIKSKV